MQHITFHGSDNKIAICTRSTADEEADEEKDEDEDEDTDGAGVRLQIQGGIDDDEEQHRPRADSASQQHRILQPQTLQETANLAVFVSTVATAAVSTASAAAAAATTSAQEASGIPALSTSRNINPILNNIPASSAPPQPLRQSTSSSTATVAATAAAASSSSLQKRSRSDFKFGETLGEGSYSSVIVATESSTGRRFAVKILSKAHIIKEKKIKYVQIEKDVLNRLSHPFIIKLYYTFQDSHSLYFVLEYARKGDLLALIRKLPRYQMDAACWYTAELITAVEYLHSCGVIHRDIKPENILLDDDNHIRLADFGSAKDLTLSQQQQEHQGSSSKHSFVGTAEYCSPELLSDKDVSFKSDIWAIGCVLYQLLCLAPPFKGANEYQTFQKIIHLEYSFPDQIQTSYRASLAAADGVGGSIDLPSNSSGGSSDKLDEILSSTAKDLISSILQLEPEQRPDFNTIKKHPMFTSTISSSSAPHSNNIIDYWSSLHLQSPPNFPFKTTANNNGSLEKLSVDSDIAFQFGDGLRLQVVDDQKSHTQQFYEDDDDGETEEENTPMYLTPQPSHLNPRDIPVAGTFTATTSSTHNANPVLGLSGNNLIVSSPSQERFVFATKSYHSIGNNINNASLTGRSSPLTVQAMGHPLPLPIPVSKILDAQLLSPYANLLFPREILIREGPVAKKRRVPLLLGGGTRKRTLILTDTPRLLLLEYERPVIKSEIPWGVIYEDPNEFSESNRTSSASGGGAISFSSSSSYSSSSPPSPISPNAASNGAILNSNINGSNSCGGFRLHPLYIKAPISVEYKNPNQFCVRTPTKDYNLDDLRGNARAWVDAIQQMIDKVNDGSLFKRQWKMI